VLSSQGFDIGVRVSQINSGAPWSEGSETVTLRRPLSTLASLARRTDGPGSLNTMPTVYKLWTARTSTVAAVTRAASTGAYGNHGQRGCCASLLYSKSPRSPVDAVWSRSDRQFPGSPTGVLEQLP
jgi:hypothetical protein